MHGISGAPEKRILLAAFNKTIAKELQARSNGKDGVKAQTLHGLGFSFIVRAWREVRPESDNESGDRARWLSAKAAPSAPDEMLGLITKLHTKIRETEPLITDLDDPVQRAAEIANQYDLTPDDDWIERGWNLPRVAERAIMAVEHAKAKPTQTGFDFADMLFLPLVHKLYFPSYNLVCIDEAQDMSKSQIQLARAACFKDGRIVVIGDDRQAIYSWRGADSGAIDRMKKELRAEELGLTVTFRCPKKVVSLASEIVPDFTAGDTAPEGIIETVTKEKLMEVVRPGDFVISRVNAPLGSIAMALWKNNIRAKIRGREIGAGLLSKLKSFKVKEISELVGKVTAWKHAEMEKYKDLPEDKVAAFMERINDQAELYLSLSEGLQSVGELEARIRNLFVEDGERGAVMLMSGHRSKGLEADNVFLLAGTMRKGSREEDNIRYVMITRAKNKLVWVTGYEK
jgi:superfamily I DNA/RNA helicase